MIERTEAAIADMAASVDSGNPWVSSERVA